MAKGPGILFLLRVFLATLFQREQPVRDADFPESERWWRPIERPADPTEAAEPCPHCGRPLGDGLLRICPGCGVRLHAACYEDTEGGRAFATEGCAACRGRTYWR